MVVYADGSCRPNPGFGGYGLFGYTYKSVPRDKNTKHPMKAALRFTPHGVSKDKSDETIEVLNFYESAYAIDSSCATNNIAELMAAIHVLEWMLVDETIKRVLILTDSSYVVNSFTNNLKTWAKKDYRKQDGQVVSNVELWRSLEALRGAIESKGSVIEMQWVKGHSGDYGNDMADMYSVIASNAARLQKLQPSTAFVTSIHDSKLSYAEYKAGYEKKDIVYFFKDLFFSSQKVQDSDHCFLSTTKDEPNTGRRTTDSIFLVNKGFVPLFINKVKSFYRDMTRNYTCTCSMKLTKLENRDVLRIADQVPVEYLLLPIKNTPNRFGLIGTEGVFLQENTVDYPFIVNISKLSSAMARLGEEGKETTSKELLETFIKDGKLTLTTKDKFLDLSEHVKEELVFTQKPLLGIGYDIPGYLALKNLEDSLTGIEVVLEKDKQSNFYTLYTKFKTADRELCSVNMLNKYLAVTVKRG